MQKFDILTSKAAPLDLINIDTDMIIPKQFLKTIKRTGLGKNLFHEMRFQEDGSEIADFVLNKEDYKDSKILISGDNFGCGSSREHAPWALIDFGIKAIISTSFADIFYNNCFKNGILPIILKQEEVDELMAIAGKPNNSLTIDLEKQEVISGNRNYKFDVDDFRKYCLLNGLDDIALTLQKSDQIQEFEQNNKKVTPWLYN